LGPARYRSALCRRSCGPRIQQRNPLATTSNLYWPALGVDSNCPVAGSLVSGPAHDGTGRHTPGLATARRFEMAYSGSVWFLAELRACRTSRKSRPVC